MSFSPSARAGATWEWYRRRWHGRDPESGQVLVSFAVLLLAMVTMLALVVDLGLLFTQRRFDQNGADAAALAAARLLGDSLSPVSTGAGLQFGVTDAAVYAEARRYAGLDPVSTSAGPTGINRSAGLTGRSALAVTLEYAIAGTWCYSPAGPAPQRDPAVPPCILPIVAAQAYPPLPAALQPYRVRVTVSSTTTGFFAGVIGTDDAAPPPAEDEGTPACLPVSGAAGFVTCAQAVAAIRGTTVAQSSAPIIPVTTADCQIAPAVPGTFFQLWGGSTNGCGLDVSPWNSLLDFTAESHWCNTLKGNDDPDYRYTNLLPPGAQVASGPCQYETPDPTWDRGGYAADTEHPGRNEIKEDVPFWVAKGFRGAIRTGYSDGNRFPTYVHLQSSPGGVLGQNIAAGFYCSSSGATANACATSVNPAGTYFFAQNQAGYHDVCPDRWGQEFGVGCRDAAVITWVQAQWVVGVQQGGTAWSDAPMPGGGPARVRAARLVTFRLYCGHAGGLCTEPPKAVVGNAANSSVWGRVVSPLIAGPCPTCTTGPTLLGNKVSLE